MYSKNQIHKEFLGKKRMVLLKKLQIVTLNASYNLKIFEFSRNKEQ